MVWGGCDGKATRVGDGGDVDIEPLAGEVGERLLDERGVSGSEILLVS